MTFIGMNNRTRGKRLAGGTLLLALAALATTLFYATSPLFAQATSGSAEPALSGAASGSLTLWTDPKTGEVFTRPGRGRVPLILNTGGGASAQHAVEEQLQEQKAQTAKLAQQLDQQQKQTAAVTKQVQEVTPAWQDYLASYKNKVSIGTQVWFGYSLFSHTGWGPQYLTQQIWPGPGNDGYNDFFLHRGYLNFFFYPTEDWTVRVTPNIYTMQGSTANQAFGGNAGIPNTNVGNLGYRIKYAYLQYNTPFKNLGIDAIKTDKIIIGVQPQPITAWEEDLYGYRFVNLTTWNMSEASTYPGLSVQGPITFGKDNLQYIDYNIGVFDNASFHAFEGTNTKEVQGRVSIYPFGARWRFQGLGITSYYAFGYGNNTPDQAQLSTPFKGPNSEIERLAEIVHYDAENWGIAFEYDWGRNAWSPGNMFSGSGPAALYGLTPNAAFIPKSVAINQAAYANLADALLNNGRSYQRGYNFFGHYHLPQTRYTLFGWIEQWNANTQVKNNPFDFERVVLGVAYQWNEYLRFALDTQNTLFYHSQYNMPVSYAKQFNWSAPKGFTGTSIPDVVTSDTHMFMLNAEFVF
ncbi:MAG TPA: hypothetical protein VMV27_03440 [Candidatus Binataceae bacterium]|nr:hypothetical protein [Candidatus Binataceae bacterium]